MTRAAAVSELASGSPSRSMKFDQIGRNWLSGGDANVTRYYYRHLHPAHSTRQRLRTLARRRAPLWWPQQLDRRDRSLGDLQLELPADAIAAFSAQAAELLKAPDLAAHGRYIVLRGHGSDERFVLLLFAAGNRRPLAIMKVARGSCKELQRERDVLLQLRPRLPEDLARSVPEPLALLEHQQHTALLLTHLAGVPAYIEVVGAWRPRYVADRHLRAAAEWLGRFHLATLDPEGPLSAEQLEQDLLAGHRRLQPDAKGVPDWGMRLLDLWDSSRPPATGVHRDFWSRNLLIDDSPGSLPAVVDWADFRARGELAEDLFHFPLSYGLGFPWHRHRQASPVEAFRLTFLEENRVSIAVLRYLALYCRTMDLEPKILEPLFLFHLLRRTSPRDAVARTDLAASGLTDSHWLEFFKLLSCAERSVFSG